MQKQYLKNKFQVSYARYCKVYMQNNKRKNGQKSDIFVIYTNWFSYRRQKSNRQTD